MPFGDELISVVAPRQSIQRGRRYAAEGRVTVSDVTDRQVTASVRGTAPYRVELSIVGDQLDGIASAWSPHQCRSQRGETRRFG